MLTHMQTLSYNSELQLFLTATSGITETCTHFVDSAREDHPHLTTVFLRDALQHQPMGGMGAVHADTTVQTQKHGLYRPYIFSVLYTVTVMGAVHADTTVQTQKHGLYRPYIVSVCCTQ